MFTYQLERRHFDLKGKPTPKSVVFPNSVVLEVRLAPMSPFGGSPDKGRTVPVGGARIHYDGNTGRLLVSSQIVLRPVRVNERVLNVRVGARGNILFIKAQCHSINEVETYATLLQYFVPLLLLSLA